MTDMTFDQLATYFHHTGELLGHYDPAPILDHLRQKLADSVAANFRGEHTPDDRPWKPILDRTHKPLQKSGDLMQAAIEAAWHSLQDDGLAIDTSLLPSYWSYQQRGTRTIPSREFAGIPPSLLAEAERLLVEDVLTKMQPPG